MEEILLHRLTRQLNILKNSDSDFGEFLDELSKGAPLFNQNAKGKHNTSGEKAPKKVYSKEELEKLKLEARTLETTGAYKRSTRNFNRLIKIGTILASNGINDIYDGNSPFTEEYFRNKAIEDNLIKGAPKDLIEKGAPVGNKNAQKNGGRVEKIQGGVTGKSGIRYQGIYDTDSLYQSSEHMNYAVQQLKTMGFVPGGYNKSRDLIASIIDGVESGIEAFDIEGRVNDNDERPNKMSWKQYRDRINKNLTEGKEALDAFDTYHFVTNPDMDVAQKIFDKMSPEAKRRIKERLSSFNI